MKSVVNMSQISAREHAKSHAAQNHWIGERLLDRTPMLTAHVRPMFFAEWLDWYWGTDGTSGVIRLPMGDGRHAPIAGEDQAYVIAALLEHPEEHDRKIYPLVGPVELNQHGIADALSRALGIPVHYEPIEIAEFTDGLTSKGFPAHLVQHLGAVVQDYQDGIFAGTNDYIETIGGKTPMTVEEYAQAHREAFSHDCPRPSRPRRPPGEHYQSRGAVAEPATPPRCSTSPTSTRHRRPAPVRSPSPSPGSRCTPRPAVHRSDPPRRRSPRRGRRRGHRHHHRRRTWRRACRRYPGCVVLRRWRLAPTDHRRRRCGRRGA